MTTELNFFKTYTVEGMCMRRINVNVCWKSGRDLRHFLPLS